ncbi:uncharacterized protein LY89DRAFT_709993 [Mollisia scopiformis]|uniref:Uncharacterized protein n=1 Tax=Mollisia scopiformis TaxID=149040 RepID=A0A194WW19_MOLSC|nr:uncharacterized protein LY89DRAFT_709993 [Mollisia scopiformis]KUJ12165.1 hypothetical protein LY89DRAFT_709993 [Mollisia scopiformis]
MAPLVVAQTPYYADQSAPFNLVLHSASTSLDGAALFSCHEGAAIEGLCVTTDFNPVEPVSPYNFNYSSLSTPDPVLGYQGLLTWELQAGSFNLSSPMALQNISDTNVENAFFEPSTTGTLVGFDQSNLLYILDDTTTEPGYSWYGEPDNASCVGVDVERVFI